MSDLSGHAVRIAEELGAAVFPVLVEDDPAHPGKTVKRPLVKGWSNGAARSTPEGIEALFAEHPESTHVGLQTGRLLVIDLDGEAAQSWWREHVDMLPPTRTQRTRRPGGLHLYYTLPSGVELRNSAGKIAPGVDIRASGGFVVDWSTEHPPAVDEVTEAPASLVEFIRAAGNAKPAAPAAPSPSAKVSEGGRNDYLSREGFRLRKQGYSVAQIAEVLRALNRAHCEPPLDEQEVADIAAGKARVEPQAQLSYEDFYCYMVENRFIFVPTRQTWPGESVSARLPPKMVGGKPMKAAAWLAARRPVEQLTWAPGEPMIVANRIISDGGWLEHAGCTTFNLYRGPTIQPGDAREAGPWLDHLHRVYPRDAEHLKRFFAHRARRPGEKINHAVVLGGPQGIGKDTLLEPLKHAVGPWNFAEVSPIQLLGRFNGFIKSVVLRISEARDLGDVDRFALYEHGKAFCAAPPDVLRCDEKHLREHAVLNVTGVIFTTNNKSNGIYLPDDDRRHFVAWSDCTKEEFTPEYWNTLWRWYWAGGLRHVAAYLAELDLADFDPKAPPPKTQAWREIVASNRAPEDAPLSDALDALGKPPAVTIAMIATRAADDFREWLLDRRNARQVPYRLESTGYVSVNNDGAKDGYWVVLGKRAPIYAMKSLSLRDRIAAAAALAAGRSRP